MTGWDATDYARRSGLQEAMAEEMLSLLDLKGSERVFDVGCGDAKIPAEIVALVEAESCVHVITSISDRKHIAWWERDDIQRQVMAPGNNSRPAFR